MSESKFNIVVAVDENHGIGKDGSLPWKLSGDLKYFKTLTTKTVDANKQNAVIMGRKTWDSLPANFKPLPLRINVVVSRNENLQLSEVAYVAKNLNDALMFLSKDILSALIEGVFIIGGGQIYREAISHPQCERIFLTEIKKTFDCDTVFPSIPDSFKKTLSKGPNFEGDIEYFFSEFVRDS